MRKDVGCPFTIYVKRQPTSFSSSPTAIPATCGRRSFCARSCARWPRARRRRSRVGADANPGGDAAGVEPAGVEPAVSATPGEDESDGRWLWAGRARAAWSRNADAPRAARAGTGDRSCPRGLTLLAFANSSAARRQRVAALAVLRGASAGLLLSAGVILLTWRLGGRPGRGNRGGGRTGRRRRVRRVPPRRDRTREHRARDRATRASLPQPRRHGGGDSERARSRSRLHRRARLPRCGERNRSSLACRAVSVSQTRSGVCRIRAPVRRRVGAAPLLIRRPASARARRWTSTPRLSGMSRYASGHPPTRASQRAPSAIRPASRCSKAAR